MLHLPLTILHLTDLHFASQSDRFPSSHYWNTPEWPGSGEPEYNRRGLLASVLKDLEENGWQPDLVIVSGDLLDRGQESGVPLAIDFLSRLSEGLSLERDRFVLVPGNHDEDRSAPTPEERYSHFSRIWDGFYGPLRPWVPGRPANAQVELFDLREQLGVQIIGFNSCEGHDRGLFIGGAVGVDQRDRAERLLRQSGVAPFRIAVMHHHLYNPPGTRKELSVMEGATEIRRWLKKHRFQLAVHGHQHVDWREEDSADDWTLTVVAGASAGVGKYGREPGELRVGYQVIQIENEGRGRRFRRWYDPNERSFMQAPPTREEHLRFGAWQDRTRTLPPPPNYEILGLLGEGPMGVTYRVRYLPLNQVRTIKVLLEQQADDASIRILKNESEVLSRLEHIGIVKIHEINLNANYLGYYYSILEYAEGRNLRAILDASRQLPLHRALRVVEQILVAIQHAHEHGIIHCDLKPINIIVDSDNDWRVHVVEFGRAWFLQSGQRPATRQTPGEIGTPGYRAPELDSGEHPTVQSDLYSIGVIFYEMVVGRRPEEVDTLPEVDVAVWQLVGKLLEHDPRNRPSSVAEVLKALKGIRVSKDKSPSHPKLPVLEMNLRLMVQERHLPEHFRRLSTPVQYARYFEFVAHEPRELAAKAQATLLERTVVALEEFNQPWPLSIDGASGTGKTAFLAALYWYLHERREKDANAPIPLYLNLASYDTRKYDGPSETHFQKAQAALQEDLAPYLTLRHRHPEQRFIAIIDHFDMNGRFSRRLRREVLSHCQPGDRLSLIIGGRPERDADLISFKGVSTRLDTFEEFVRLFAEAHGLRTRDIVQHVTQQIKDFKLEEIDCRMLWLLLLLGRHSRQPLNLSELYEWECKSFLAKHDVTGSGFLGLQRPAELAFRYEVVRDDISSGEEVSDVVSWKLLRESSHATRCFLVAVHIVGTLRKAARGGELPAGADQVLSYFYPWMITRFCRELIATIDKNQHLIVDAAETIFDRAPVSKHAIMYFILGRVENRDAKRKAFALLKKQKQVLAASRLDPSITKVLERTIEVSLIILQASTAEEPSLQASQRYIRTLIQDPEADALNRGFLITYYEDVPFEPTQEPVYEDELAPCPRTFENHYKVLERAIRRGTSYSPLFELKLYSLCSLAYHRHLAGKLADPDRERILGLVQRILRNSHALNLESLCQELMLYLQMIERTFERRVFSPGAVIEELYALKTELRQGWVRNNLRGRGESVAEHLYGAFLLAWLYLPESTEYSKDKILRMLLLHDLNEAFTGDKIPGEKTGNDWAVARRSIDYLAMLGTHKDLPGLTSLKEAWSGFAAGEGIEARIAKDFDLLELLVQLLLYLKGHQLPPMDDAHLRKRITDEISTPQGKRVLEIIIRHFDGPEAPLDS